MVLLQQYAASTLAQLTHIRYFCQDESRFGLKTLIARLISACGVKPIGQWQWLFQAFWLYGAVEPLTGEHWFWHFSQLDPDCDQRFLNDFAAHYAESLNILQVENGRFHKAQRLRVPENVILLFHPPYCPQLNPIERVWEYLKRDLCWHSFPDLSQLQTNVDELLNRLTSEVVASLTGYDFILDALSVANIF